MCLWDVRHVWCVGELRVAPRLRSRTVAVIVMEKRRLILIVERLHFVIFSPTRPTFSPYTAKKTCKTSEYQLRHLRRREMDAQERGETSDDEQEGQETEDEGCFTPR